MSDNRDKLLDLVKGVPPYVVRGKGLSKADKPPSGYSPIPGGKKGGYRKRTASGWDYWYPDGKQGKESKHHVVSATSTSRRNGGIATKRKHGSSTITTFTIEDPTLPGGQRYHKYDGYGATPTARRTHALQAHAASHGIEKPIKHTSGKKAYDARVAAANDTPEVGTAPKGYHQIATPDGPQNVKTGYTKGLYHVHGKATPSGTGRGNSNNYTLTHGPTGMRIAVFSTKAKASAAARHFANEAPDAGKSARFGSRPSKADLDALRAAHKTLPSALLKSAANRGGSVEKGVTENTTYSPDVMAFYSK